MEALLGVITAIAVAGFSGIGWCISRLFTKIDKLADGQAEIKTEVAVLVHRTGQQNGRIDKLEERCD